MNPSPPPPAPPPKKKPTKGPPWSDLETSSLIKAYEEKWYSLKRGLLRSHQWESVATDVASRCGLTTPSKTGIQCRHKMEKLRKRYREERQRPLPSRWPLFELMDQLERGPFPISARPPPQSKPDIPEPDETDDIDDDDVDEEEEDEEEEVIVLNNSSSKRGGEFAGGATGKRMRSGREEESAWRDEALSEIASVMMRFEEGFLRIEKRRMEIMREFEKDLMELEAKRAEMAFESRRCLMDMVDRFRSIRKAKKPPQI